MIDWFAVVEGVGLLGAGSMFLVKVGRHQRSAQAEVDAAKTAAGAAEAHIERHEEECGRRYGEINRTLERIEDRLSRRDEVDETRQRETDAHRTATAVQLSTLNAGVEVLREAQRQRERLEDREP